MDEKINVLNVRINNIGAKEAVKELIHYMRTEPVSVIEIVTVDILMKAGELLEFKEEIEGSDLVLAGERAILEAAGITEKKRLTELEPNWFLKMTMRYFHKNHVRVFLLGDNQVKLSELEKFVRLNYEGIRIAGAEIIGNETPDDLILNLINGAETECVLAAQSSPLQERFISRNRALINTRVWLGVGQGLESACRTDAQPRSLRNFFAKHLFRKEMEREKRRNCCNAE